MKKNILIGVLSICLMTSLGYGVIQQSEAENQRKRADEMEALAKRNEVLAKQAHEQVQNQFRIVEEHTRRAEAIKDSLIRTSQESEKRRKK